MSNLVVMILTAVTKRASHGTLVGFALSVSYTVPEFTAKLL